MGFIHDLNLWLTFEIGSDAVMTPVYTGLILLALALGLSYLLKEESPSMLASRRSKAICMSLGITLLGLFAIYMLSMRIDDRLAVAEKIRLIRIRGGTTAATISRLAPSVGILTDKFAWVCAMEKDAWDCVKSRAYLSKTNALVH